MKSSGDRRVHLSLTGGREVQGQSLAPATDQICLCWLLGLGQLSWFTIPGRSFRMHRVKLSRVVRRARGDGGVGGQLAAVARSAAERYHRRQRACRSSGVPPRTSRGSSRCRAGPAPRRSSGTTESSSTWRRRTTAEQVELWSVDRASGNVPVEASDHGRQLPDQQAEHVVAVAGDGRHQRLGPHRPRHPEGVRLRRQGAVDARHSEGLRDLRAELGLRILTAPCIRTRCTCRSSTG